MLLLWVGWFGFNPGSTGAMSTQQAAQYASNAAMTTSISPAAAGSFTIFYDIYLTEFEHLDVVRIANCVISGLVAITSGCNVLSPWASVLVGGMSCVVYVYGTRLLHKLEIDDVVDAVPVHLFNGAWGCIATGLLHPDKGLLTTGMWGLLGTQLISIVVLAGVGFIPVYGLCWLLKRQRMLRAPLEAEIMGLDLYIFAAQAYANMDEVDDAYDDIPADNEPPPEVEASSDNDEGYPDTFRSFGPPRLPRRKVGNMSLTAESFMVHYT